MQDFLINVSRYPRYLVAITLGVFLSGGCQSACAPVSASLYCDRYNCFADCQLPVLRPYAPRYAGV